MIITIFTMTIIKFEIYTDYRIILWQININYRIISWEININNDYRIISWQINIIKFDIDNDHHKF